MSDISLFPEKKPDYRRSTFKFEEPPPPNFGCYYSRVERMMSRESLLDFQIIVNTLYRGKLRKIKAPPVVKTSLDPDGMLTFVCGPITPEEQFTAHAIDLLDDEDYVLLPLSWVITPVLICPNDTLKITFGMRSKKFLEEPHLWDETIQIDFNGTPIHLSR